MALTVSGGHRVSLGDGDHDVMALRFAKIQAGEGVNHFNLINGGRLDLSGTDTVTMRWGSLEIGDAGTALVTMLGGGGAIIEGGAMSMRNSHLVDTYRPISGQTTMIGGAGTDIFRFDARGLSGNHTIEGFQAGVDKLFIPKHSLAQLNRHGEIHEENGNTVISLHGGATTIELVGVTGLTAGSFLKH